MRYTTRTLGMLALLSAVGCAVNPVTGSRELALVSEADEIAMGRAGAAAVAATVGLVPDVPLQSYVDRIGQTLSARTERPALDWQFRVVDDAAVNAFALPGGYIFVTRGLLSHLNSEAELASVLGHESGHVAARHSVQQMSRQQLASFGLGVGSAIVPAIAKIAPIAGAGVGLLFLKYGRDDETQADRLGYRYALSAGYDTREMIGVFQMLERDAQLSGAGRLPSWQSTHPDPGNRIREVQRMVAVTGDGFGATRSGRTEFYARIDGLVYGEDPRAGYFVEAQFVHPGLALTLRFPAGWATQNAPEAVRAISAANDALLEMRLALGSPTDAASRFASQEGVSATVPVARVINGFRAVTSEFSAAASETGAIRGVATFVEVPTATIAIIGYTTGEHFAQYEMVMHATMASIARLTDPRALAVQPLRVRIETVARAMTLAEYNVERPSSISLAELAVINGMNVGARLSAGQSVKRVVGVAAVPPEQVP
jgi:predicted Zn-dependent protease